MHNQIINFQENKEKLEWTIQVKSYTKCFLDSRCQRSNVVGKAIRQNNHQLLQNGKRSNLQNNQSNEPPTLNINHGDGIIVSFTFVLIDFSRNCLFTDRTIFATSCFSRYLGLHTVQLQCQKQINKWQSGNCVQRNSLLLQEWSIIISVQQKPRKKENIRNINNFGQVIVTSG